MRGVIGMPRIVPRPAGYVRGDGPHDEPKDRPDGEHASGSGVEPRAEFELEQRAIPEPGPEDALVRVHACGVCHSDTLAKLGGYPGMSYPLIPGHEIAGEIAALGDRVKGWTVGRRVGIGWFGATAGIANRVAAAR
jgi:D-arabinose 1-dehydrogenase-like Zn-dependent alcohol dehydrogenase